MELLQLEEDGGTALPVAAGSSPILLGRTGTNPDTTVSRRHLSLHVPQSDALSLSFQVIGKNPILVVQGGNRRIYRSAEKGELQDGDSFSLSLRNPRFYRVKEVGSGVREAVRRREERTLQRKRQDEEERETRKEEQEASLEGEVDLQLGDQDISEIDPVKEFGFLVRGHEFDEFPRQRIRPIEEWNWFLDDPRDNSDVDEDDDDDNDLDTNTRKKRKSVKKRKGEDEGDEVWTGESEDEKSSQAEVQGAKKRKYSTRSHDQKRKDKDDSSTGKPRKSRVVQDIEEDEEDETLGGFIVNDEEEEETNEEEQEDELDDDEDEDD